MWERDTRVPGPVRAARASLLPPRRCACPTQVNFVCGFCRAVSWAWAPAALAPRQEGLQTSASPAAHRLIRRDAPRIIVLAVPAARTASRHSWMIASARIQRTLPWGGLENFTRRYLPRLAAVRARFSVRGGRVRRIIRLDFDDYLAIARRRFFAIRHPRRDPDAMLSDREQHPRTSRRNPLHRPLRILRHGNGKQEIRFVAGNVIHIKCLHARVRYLRRARRGLRKVIIELDGNAVRRRVARLRIRTLLRAGRLWRGARFPRRCLLLPDRAACRRTASHAVAGNCRANGSPSYRQKHHDRENACDLPTIPQRHFPLSAAKLPYSWRTRISLTLSSRAYAPEAPARRILSPRRSHYPASQT